MPPTAVNVVDGYCCLTIPFGSGEGVMIVGCGTAVIDIGNCFVTVAAVGTAESRSLKVGETVCIVAGVPLILPDEFRFRPFGKEPEERLQE